MEEQSDSSGHASFCISAPGQAKQAASVIHVSRPLTGTEFLKLPTIASEGELLGTTSDEPDSLRRRELLARRPSYRKLFNDLTTDQQSYIVSKVEEDSSDGRLSQDSNDNSNDAATAIGLSSQAFQLVSHKDDSESGLQALSVGNVASANVPTSGTTTVIQYTQGADGGQYFIPGIMVSSGGVDLNSSQQVMEETSRKRELRLLKNKEAAKECRRKKKEYVKCLENRVAVLENQNKTLIEELKSLKELYCQKEVHS